MSNTQEKAFRRPRFLGFYARELISVYYNRHALSIKSIPISTSFSFLIQ